MARKRLEGTALKTYDDVDAALKRIGEIDRDLALSQAATDEAIDKIKQGHKEHCEPLHVIKASLERQIKEFAESRRIDFTEKRSRELTFGSIGFRLSSSITIKNAGDTLKALLDLGLSHCVRTKQEPDKEAMKLLSTETLASVGAALSTKDAFGYEVKHEAIPEPVAS